ncbi:hypothetical protein [Streptomyces nigra]|uniref:hypothetical protein n=1 Tax=Streptomyces nigra TaxID=1827580 RepID=UPI003650FBB8
MTDRHGPINSDAINALHIRLKAAEATCNRLFASIPLICSDERHEAKARGLEADLTRVRAELRRLFSALDNTKQRL